MKGSLRLFKFAGIPVYIHWTFLILLAWIFGISLYRGQGAAEGLRSAGFVLAVFACVVLHEFGHALTAQRFGISTRDITLLPIGGVARLERMPDKPAQEIIVALAGPMVNVVIAGVLFAISGIQSFAGVTAEQILSAQSGTFLHSLMVINIFLVLFNLIPAFPMDGGRVLRATLALFMEYPVATRIAATVGQGCAVLFALAGLFGNPFLILIAVFVWLGAQAEAQAVETRSLFSGVPAREAMVTNFKALDENATLDEALKTLLNGSQPDFPVMEGDEMVGVLPRNDLLRAIAANPPTTAVAAVMRRDCATAQENEPLDRVVDRMSESGCPLVPVLRQGRLVGIITSENIGELMSIRAKLGTAWHRRDQNVAGPAADPTPTVRPRSIPHVPS